MQRATIAALGLWVVAACGGASAPSAADAGRDSGTPAADSGPLVLTDIEVDVSSDAASFTGRVLVGAFRMDPPTMPPVALARVTDPTFPLTTTLRDVEPGTYWVIGVLDFDPPSATIPGPEETTASVGPVTLDGSGAPAMVELTLDVP